jgi:hypothetical protein
VRVDVNVWFLLLLLLLLRLLSFARTFSCRCYLKINKSLLRFRPGRSRHHSIVRSSRRRRHRRFRRHCGFHGPGSLVNVADAISATATVTVAAAPAGSSSSAQAVAGHREAGSLWRPVYLIIRCDGEGRTGGTDDDMNAGQDHSHQQERTRTRYTCTSAVLGCCSCCFDAQASNQACKQASTQALTHPTSTAAPPSTYTSTMLRSTNTSSAQKNTCWVAPASSSP